MSRQPLIVLVVVATACEHQYLVIPAAEVVPGTIQYSYEGYFEGGAAPTWTVVEGSPTLAPGDRAVVRVDFSAVIEVDVTEIVFLGLDTGDTEFGSHWRMDLTDEELAQGWADVELAAVAGGPPREWCQRDYRGIGTCYQEADQGVTGLGVVAAAGDTTTQPGIIPLDLDPLRPSDDACADFDLADCCGGGDGYSVVACYVVPPCGCPQGTTDYGTQGDGTTMCMCP
jgi:hypothetical protein